MIRKAGNQGVVLATAAAAGDIVHLIPTGRSVFLRKVFIYNATGANVVVTFGTRTTAAAFVALMPPMLALTGFENTWQETEIPCVEWILDTRAGALGRSGDMAFTSVAGILVLVEVEERFTNT